MKLVMYGEPFQERPGVIIEDQFILNLELAELESPHSLEEILQFDLLEQVEEMIGMPQPEEALIPLGSVRLGPPLSGMGKIVAVGANYLDHIKEMGNKVPERPLLFAKPTSAIAGPYDDLMLPPASWSTEVDYEVELAAVISHPCHEVSADDALAFVAGYTVLNDVTARDIQRAESQWLRAKGYDGFCPLGPYLVTADEIENVQHLALTTTINGQLRQNGNTSQMLFSVAEIISFVSHTMTLLPGDIITTGTPAGIGGGMKPPVYLQPGDVIEMTVEGVGNHRYTVRAYER